MRALYLDLDGTLLGPSGSVVEAAEGTWSLDGLRALEACDRAGVEVVLMSGRARGTLAEDARLLGVGSYVCELGGCVVIDGAAHWPAGELGRSADQGTVFEQIAARGAPALLLEHFAGRLEPHAPWDGGRDVSHLFRGRVDVAEAEALLTAHGHAALRLVDNGAAPAGRVYHLLPREASKAAGVAFHRRARGYARRACAAVGDAPEDLGVAGQVGAFWLVGNALVDGDPDLREAVARHANVALTRGHHGAGVLEAVRAALEGA